MKQNKRPRALDIALRSGLSTSTVDRVLNRRGRVSEKAVRLVMEAQTELEQRAGGRQQLAGSVEVVLPENAGNSTRYLGAYFRRAAHRNGVAIKVNWVDRMNPAALSAALLETLDRRPRGVAFQALDHPLVHEAVTRLRSEGVRLMTIVSDLPGEGAGYVGMDNRAAGRTAGLLMGNYCACRGAVAVVWSAQLSRAHEERESGFRAVMRAEFPEMVVKDVNGGYDQPQENFRLIRDLLKTDGSIAGIYCVGAGPSSIVDAVRDSGQSNRVKIFAHNLTHVTRAHLLASEIDVVIHQRMYEIADRALEGLLSGNPLGRHLVATHIITRENALRHLDLDALNDWLES